MGHSLLLDTVTWDFVVDNNGNWAICQEPYSYAQDVACACRLFKGELYYDTSQGIPYFDQVLGHWPPLSLLKQYFVTAAFTVPNVVKAKAFIKSWTNRQVSGQVQIVDINNVANVANF